MWPLGAGRDAAEEAEIVALSDVLHDFTRARPKRWIWRRRKRFPGSWPQQKSPRMRATHLESPRCPVTSEYGVTRGPITNSRRGFHRAYWRKPA
jgi:hypothetical protein